MSESVGVMWFRRDLRLVLGADHGREGEVEVRRPGDGDFREDRSVVLDLEFNGVHPDPWGGTRSGFSAETEISRKEFGVDFEIPMDGGGVVVGDKIKVVLEVEAVLQPALVEA